jgi:hypothetical protein
VLVSLCSRLRVRVRVRITLRLAVYSQSVRLRVRPLEAHDQYFIFQLNTCGYSPYVTSSLMIGWVCRLQLLLVLASAVILELKSRGTHGHILLSDLRLPNLEGQVLVFISPRNRVAQLYPRALGSLFLASYDSQGYVGSIRTRLHTGLHPQTACLLLYLCTRVCESVLSVFVYDMHICAHVYVRVCLVCLCTRCTFVREFPFVSVCAL